MPSIRVFILVSSEEDSGFANSVCESLSAEFWISKATVRSSALPLDRLQTIREETTQEELLLWVLLNGSNCVVTEGVEPVLELTTANNNPKDISLKIAKVCGLAAAELRDSNIPKALKSRRQARLVDDAQLHTKSPQYQTAIAHCFDQNAQISGDAVEAHKDKRKVGKVRDRYQGGQTLALVTTDRQSGFDRQLARVPFKGAVLNLTSAFWFSKTQHIIPNHLIEVPHPNVSIVKKCKPFPIEFVVRSYMTGSTSTSIWKNYQDGVRNYCGHALPEGMKKNQKLAKNLLTPTTKEEEHDRPISAEDIVKESWMTQQDFDVCATAALQVFALGQELAAERGLILVDTKYEFGRDLETGEILLIDEVHTPDSSRYWLASTYQQRIAAGKEPDNIDKEFLRLWFRNNCDPYKDETLPEAPRDLVCELARRYITLYEMITWKTFDFDAQRGEAPIGEALEKHLK